MWFSIAFSFILSVSLIPIIIKICAHYKLYDPVNARKIHSGNIPRLGGVGIIIAFLASAVVYSLVLKCIPIMQILPLLIAGLLIFGFGFIDDLFDMPAKLKFCVQLTASCIVVFSGFRFQQIFKWVLPLWVSIPLSVGWMIGIINAYNLIDGLDGLCGGLSFLTILALGIIFYSIADPSAALCFIMAAAILGFLIYNWPPAKIFMGDNGSQFMGFMIAAVPLYYSTDNFEYNKFLIMLVLVSVPMMDTIAAIWRRLRDKRPIMSPDRAHLHHKLLNLGYTKKQAMCMLLLIQFMLCVAVYLAMYLSRSKGAILLFVVYTFMTFFFSVIHFTNRAVLTMKRRRNLGLEDEESEDDESENQDN
jgi:UDP-GlcNAc:undecaprenyl-phosphate/decaprenyl-phosphate GlcNAc-1-phosphate transferase